MKTILIAESAPTPRDLLVHCLRRLHRAYRYGWYGSRRVAIRTEPDLIFMALALPGLHGAAATRQIKAQRRLYDIPIVALTTAAVSEEATCASAADCDDTLGKPFDAEQIDAMVRKFLGGG